MHLLLDSDIFTAGQVEKIIVKHFRICSKLRSQARLTRKIWWATATIWA